jgi:hypothetical protein
MDFVAFIGQRLSKFGGQNAASAKSWIANNAYSHKK